MNMKDPIASDESGGFRRNVTRRPGGRDDEATEGRKPGRSRRKPLPPIPDEYVPVVEERPVGLPRKREDGGSIEDALLADGWETAEEIRPGKSVRGPVSDKPFFSEIVGVRREILENAAHGSDHSDASLRNRISGEALRKLVDLRKAELAKRIDDIVSDPTKNSKQILAELNAMKNENTPVPEPAQGKIPDPDVPIIADAFSEIDTVRTESGRSDAGKANKEQVPGRAPLDDVKEYLSELVLEHFFSGMKDGRFDKGEIPHLSLDTLLWKDGRPLLDVVSAKGRSTVAKLLKEMEQELVGLNESEVVRRMDIFNGIALSFLNIQDSIEKLGQVNDLEALESMPFPISMEKMKELGLDELPEQRRAVLVRKRKHALKRWGEAKDAARKRLEVLVSEKAREEKEKIGYDSVVPDPSRESSDKETVVGSVMEELPKSAEASDIEEAKRRARELVERQLSTTLEKIEEAERTEDAEALRSLRHLGWRVSPSAVERLVGGLDDERKAEIREMVLEMNRENGTLVKDRIDDFFLGLAKEAPNTRKLYWTLDQMSGFGPIDGKEADGKAWRKKLAHLGRSAFGMSDEEFDRGDWKEEIPESLRGTFPKLIQGWRESAKDEEWTKTLRKRVGEKPETDEAALEAEWNEKQAALDSERRGDDRVRTDSAENLPEAVAGIADRSPEGVDISDRILADESAEKTARDAMMAEARERAEASIADTPEIMYPRRNEGKTDSVSREDALAEKRKMIERLRSDAQDQGARVAALESARRSEQEQFEKSKKQNDRYKKIKDTLGKWFGSENMVAKKLQDEETQNRKHLDDLDKEIVEETKKRDRLRAELSEMEGSLEELGDSASSEKPEADSVADRSPEKEGKIYPGVPELFKGEFGIFEDDLRMVDGFDRLSWGQQRLVFENLKQITLGRIQEEAIDRADKDAKEDKWMNGTNWIRKGWKAASRKYQIAKTEKLTQDEIMRGGIPVHGEILKQLVEGAKSGPEVEYDPRTSELNVHFASGKQFADIPEGERGELDAFNTAADAFSKIPAEWRYADSAKKRDHKKYEEDERDYVEARNALLHFLEGRYGEEEAMWTINDLESKVRMTQFLRTNTDVEKQLLSIRNDAAWTRMWKDSITEHGVALGLGFGARTAAAASAGFLAAPLLPAALAAAGLVGGVRAYIRSKEQIKEKERRSRKGRGVEADPTVKKFPSRELSAELSGLADSCLDSFGENDQEEKVLQLRKSLDVIRKKMESGMVDFGTEKESSGNEYELLSALSRASAVIAMYSAEESVDFKKRFDEAVESNTRFIEGETRHAKGKQGLLIVKNIAKGAALSATFAGLGYGARYAAEHGSSIFSSVAAPDDASPSLPKSEPTGEPRSFFKSTAEPTMPTPAPESPTPVVPNPEIPPVPEEDWNLSDKGGFRNTSYQQETGLSSNTEIVPPKPVEVGSGGSGTGVGAGELHGRVSSVGVIRPGISPEQQAAIPNADSPVADPEGVSPETQAVIAEQEAAERATLEAESVSGRADTGEVSKAVSDAWNDNVERAKIGTGDDRFGLAEKVRPEITLDSQDAGTGVPDGAVGAAEPEFRNPETESVSAGAEIESKPLTAAEKADIDLGITHETERVDSTGQVAEKAPEGSPEVSGSADKAIPTSALPEQEDIRSDWKGFVEDRNMIKSDEVRGYLMSHPEHVEAFRTSLADYDASIFEAARGETGARGVANMAELSDKVAAKQVMYDCLKLLRDPLTPTYEVRTYQLANSLNFDQMRNVGEFMMKTSERFGKGAFPIGDESLRGYLERMTALLVERGETVKLNGDMRLLNRLAFQNFKR